MGIAPGLEVALSVGSPSGECVMLMCVDMEASVYVHVRVCDYMQGGEKAYQECSFKHLSCLQVRGPARSGDVSVS